MGLLGGSNPWPWPFGTTTPSTSAVGRHPDTSDTSDTQTLDTQTRSDTTHASHLSRALRHRLDTGQTPLTLLTPVSIDTAQTRLRHCSDTPDTSDTQTHQGSKAEALLRECMLDEILRRVGCLRELRVQLAQGGAPWLRLAGSRWWDRVVAAGFFLEDRDPGLSGGSWHDVGDGLRWVSTLGRSVGLRFGAPG